MPDVISPASTDQNDNSILVSIRCAVYNHEPYLRQCLDGFVMQKTSFRFEAIIHDDASTDNSASIIREYAERYPDIIRPIFQTENQYSKEPGCVSRIITDACRGKYLASCEGDDYWTDPLKLQKQVDYLEAHPDCTLCFTNAIMHWEDGSGKPDRLFAPDLEERDYYGPEITTKWVTPTASLVYRKSIVYSDFYLNTVLGNKKVRFAGDIPLILTCCHFGPIHAINQVTCVYRRQLRGFMLSSDSNRRILSGDHKISIYKVFGPEYVESSFKMSLYYYRLGLENARKEKNAKNYIILLSRIAKVYILHPYQGWKRIRLILGQRKERMKELKNK